MFKIAFYTFYKFSILTICFNPFVLKFSQLFTPRLFYIIVNFCVIWLKTVDFIKDLEEGMFSWTRGIYILPTPVGPLLDDGLK